MFKRVIAGMQYLFGLYAPGRDLSVFPDDVFIVSYPKSGNTWTRFLTGNLLCPDRAIDFSNINQIIPDPEALTCRQLDVMSRPRVIKSHQYFDPRYPRIIYIVRDPRDVAVSQYHFHRKRRLVTDGSSVDHFVTRFVAGQTSPYASWGDNVASWLITRNGRPDFLLLRYEDMLENTVRELARVASFLHIQATAEHLANAAGKSSAAEMRRLEKSQSHLWSSTRDTRQDVPFVREARSGGWQTQLPTSALKKIEAAWSGIMKYLGYELSSPEACEGVASGLLEGTLNEALR